MSEVYVVVQNFLGDQPEIIGARRTMEGAKELAQSKSESPLTWEGEPGSAYHYYFDDCGADGEGDDLGCIYYVHKTTLVD